jgi:predicted ATPase
VDEVDSRGTNTAMFINSLSERELANLSAWTQENMGFTVLVESGTGHVEVKIKDGANPPRNIADLGFGYSQVLPIVLQLWKATRMSNPLEETLLAVEQPELHLHPHYQALLADAIAATSKKRSVQSRVVVETHSDHLVNRLGRLVSDGKLSPSDIQVIVVSERVVGGPDVRVVEFDRDGLLGEGWPAGFFVPGSAE